MSFNILAETSRHLPYEKWHRALVRENLPFDLVPMPGLGPHGGDAIGICVPAKNANEATWNLLKPVLQSLRAAGCDVYDLYGGQKLGWFNLGTFKKNLLG